MGMTRCTICDWKYCDDDKADIKDHRTTCNAFLKAQVKYGPDNVMRHSDAEGLKQEGWKIVSDLSQSIDERVKGAEMIFRSLFSASVGSMFNHYSLKHPLFKAYIAMMLNQPYQRYRFQDAADVFERLLNKYGTRPGIRNEYTCWEG